MDDITAFIPVASSPRVEELRRAERPKSLNFQPTLQKSTSPDFHVTYHRKALTHVPSSMPSVPSAAVYEPISKPQHPRHASLSRVGSGLQSGSPMVESPRLSGSRSSLLHCVPSIEDMSPPTVQFMIGTPTRASSITPPSSNPCSRCNSTSNLINDRITGRNICSSPPTTPGHDQGYHTSSERLKLAFGYRTPPSLTNILDTSPSRSPSKTICNCPKGSNPSLNSMDTGGTPPPMFQYSVSSPNSFVQNVCADMEGPISFLVPELTEKTLMNKEHNDLLDKMEFVLDLSRCIGDLARERGSPLAESVLFADSPANKNSPRATTANQHLFNSESQRCLEQLLLYVRVLQLLGSTMQLAREKVASGSLQPTCSVKQSKQV
jgi:serine/threonine-protein kinase ULK/ATG1